MNKNVEVQNPGERAGFTLVEIMLVLALTGLLVVGMIAGTFSSIAAQRYNDSVRSLAEYIRTIYSEVISPETLGHGISRDKAILGKVLFFGTDKDSSRVYSATVTGSTSTDGSASGSFMTEFTKASPSLYCGETNTDNGEVLPSTVAGYAPLWEATLKDVEIGEVIFNNVNGEVRKDIKSADNFSGTLIIARTPVSSAVHTVWLPQTYDNISNPDDCRNVSDQFLNDLLCTVNKQSEMSDINCTRPGEVGYNMSTDVGFCVKGDNVSQMREVRITADGRNTSAVTILNTDVTDVNEDKDGGGNRCKW